MGILIALLAIMGYGLYVTRLVKWSLESSILYVCASLICVLYLAGLLGFLLVTRESLLGIGVLLLLWDIFARLKSGAVLRVVSPGVLFFLLSTIGLWILTRSEYYSSLLFVDDFSHWGRVSKLIVDNNRLVISTDPDWFLDYPPGMALFDYLFFQFSGFRDSDAMFAHGVFIFAALSQLFSVIPKTSNKYVFFGVGVYIYSLIYFFGLGLHTLAGDLFLGVVFGIALFEYLVEKQDGRRISMIRIIPLVMVLPLIKLTGILFSLVIGGVVLSDILLNSKNLREKIKLTIGVLGLISSCALTYASWGVHVKSMGLNETLNTGVSISEVVRAFDPTSSTERQKTTIDNFIKRAFLPDPELTISRQYYWFALCLSFVFLIGYLEKSYWSWGRLTPLAVLLAGFGAYLTVLLVLYMFSFGEYEGLRLASIERYVNSYLVGVLIVFFGVSLAQYLKEPRKRIVTVSIVTICILVMIPNLKAGLLDVYHVLRGEQNRDVARVIKYSEFIDAKTNPDSRIYFIWQGSNGTENTIFNYGIMPRESNRGCWSVGGVKNKGDVWTCGMTSDKFENTLMEYDYLLVGHADKAFEAEFLSQFGYQMVADGSLFQVLKENGHAKLSGVNIGNKLSLPR